MRVVFCGPELEKLGGVSTYAKNLLPYLDSAEYFVVGSRARDKSGLLRVLVRLLGDYIRFYKVLRNSGPTIVHLNSSLQAKALPRDFLFSCIARALGCPVVFFVHGWDQGFAQRLEKQPWIGRILFRNANVVLVLASCFKQFLIERLDIKTTVIQESTNAEDEIFDIGATCLNNTAGPDYQDTDCKVLFISRMIREKGAVEVLEVAEHVLESKPTLSFILAGDGPQLAEVRNRVRNRNLTNVQVLGPVAGTRKASLFRSCKIMIFPTTYGEGMPICILEGMAAGMAIITTPVGGIADFFKDGEMGMLISAGHPESTAKLLSGLVADVARLDAIRLFNHKYALQHFSPTKGANRLNAIYLGLINTCLSKPPGNEEV